MKKLLTPAVILAVFALDRVSKAAVLARLYQKSEAVLPFFRLTYAENTGVAFGMFRDSAAAKGVESASETAELDKRSETFVRATRGIHW